MIWAIFVLRRPKHADYTTRLARYCQVARSLTRISFLRVAAIPLTLLLYACGESVTVTVPAPAEVVLPTHSQASSGDTEEFEGVLIPQATAAAATVISMLTEVSSVPAPVETGQSAVTTCQGDRWELFPTKVYQYPEGSGWKKVVVVFAVHNGSDLWGSMSVDGTGQALIYTEDGFSYALEPGQHAFVPDQPANTPYSGSVGFSNRLPPRGPGLDLMPPNFTIRGDSSNGKLYGSPASWYQILFRVAETQNQFTVDVPGVRINCIHRDGQELREELGTRRFNLDTDIRQPIFPANQPPGAYPELINGGAIESPIGSIQFTESKRTDFFAHDIGNEELDIFFTVTNASAGYDISGDFGHSYLIGDDGLIRRPGCGIAGCGGIEGWPYGVFYAGPGQTAEATFGFIVPPDAGDLKLVLVHEEYGLYRVFDLAPSN